MKSKWIEYHGKKIFHIDLSNFGSDAEALRNELQEASRITTSQPENSVLVITDMRNTVISSTILKIAQASSSATTKYVRKTAVVGISGIRRYFMDTISAFTGQKFSAFDTLEEAMEWLTKD
jgi:hypothetical protein